MSASTRNWSNLIFLVLLFSASLALGSSFKDPPQTGGVVILFILCFIWMIVGALLDLISSSEQPEKAMQTYLGILLGYGILLLAWFLPGWFPGLKLNDYGFQFDLQKSPAVSWMAVAFILGYYRSITLMIPPAVWNQIKRSLGMNEAADLKGNAKSRFLSYWDGFKSILNDLLHLSS